MWGDLLHVIATQHEATARLPLPYAALLQVPTSTEGLGTAAGRTLLVLQARAASSRRRLLGSSRPVALVEEAQAALQPHSQHEQQAQQAQQQGRLVLQVARLLLEVGGLVQHQGCWADCSNGLSRSGMMLPVTSRVWAAVCQSAYMHP
jgi:hypothetical protein